MNYEQFITEIQKYWDLRDSGLKKQANRFLFAFTKQFKEDVSDTEADKILFRFCREYLDEMKFSGDNFREKPRRHLPFQITELLNNYLNRECEKNKMPQMRWAFQIFGAYNPHDPERVHNPYHILERAYEHEECDQQTVQLYFGEQLEYLWWGQHHFPEGCIITREEFEDTVNTANRILAEKSVDSQLAEELAYYIKLYHIYFAWQENDRNGDFYELCKKEGIEFQGMQRFITRNDGRVIMDKIIVIGSPGAGKSTFARKLRDVTHLPLYYLDQLWHKPDQTNISKEEFDTRLGEWIQKDRWIIDGNYQRTLEIRMKACDTVFLLDFPVETCLLGVQSRIGTKREELPWVETEFDEEFRQAILDFPEKKLPQIYELIEKYGKEKQVFIFRSREEENQYLQEMGEDL